MSHSSNKSPRNGVARSGPMCRFFVIKNACSCSDAARLIKVRMINV